MAIAAQSLGIGLPTCQSAKLEKLFSKTALAVPSRGGVHRKSILFQKLYEILLSELNHADKIDWSRALVDSATMKAPSGGEKTGPNPTDRRKLGSKVHILVDAKGIPLAMKLTGANSHDITQILCEALHYVE